MAKKYNPQKTLETILSVSAQLFSEKGFDRTSMQDIANTAGLSKGAIYHHFKSKDEIINAMMDNQTSRVKQRFDLWLDELGHLNAKEKIILFLEKTISDQEVHYLDKVLNTRVKSPDYVLTYMKSCVNDSAPVFSKLFEEGKKDGSIVTEYPEECAEVFFLLLNIWCDPVIFECNLKKLEKRIRYLQFLMQSTNLDIISDDIVIKMLTMLKNIYSLQD